MRYLVLLLSAVLLSPLALAESGLVTKPSPYSVGETLDRLESVLTAKGITVVMRWNHAQKADNADIPLRPTELLLFGNPKLGSHLMTSNQKSAIDLPMKAIAWEDSEGQVWLTYNDPKYIAERHGIKDRSDIINKMVGALDKFSSAATQAK